jgi:hypothetical protein
MYDETNTKTNLPAQIDLYATPGSDFNFLFMAKGGGSANKTYLYQVLCAPGHCDTMIGASLASSSSYSKLVCMLCSTANQGAAEQGVAHEVPRGQYQDHVCHPYQLISKHARAFSVLTLCCCIVCFMQRNFCVPSVPLGDRYRRPERGADAEDREDGLRQVPG